MNEPILDEEEMTEMLEQLRAYREMMYDSEDTSLDDLSDALLVCVKILKKKLNISEEGELNMELIDAITSGKSFQL